MTINFEQAANRHWRDAQLLEREQRTGNADHLYGVAAECALKAFMVELGAPTTPTGDWAGPRTHLPNVWDECQIFASGRQEARFLSGLHQFPTNPFAGWNVSQRYAADSALPSLSALQDHREASRACLTALDRALKGI